MSATLIAPLASGIAGGSSGTAEFFERDSVTGLVVYSDHDGTNAIGKTKALDANGGAEVYTKEATFVRVRDSGGIVVREFTVQSNDRTIDVESAGFTGLLASGSQGAGGVVDARTLLNRWLSSAKTTDFKVRRAEASVDETFQQAFTNVLSTNRPFFNITDYGAIGDGATDCTNAIDLCYTAAASSGGIVFIPTGTFLYRKASGFSSTSAKVSFLGVSATASILKFTVTTGTAFTISAGVSSYSGVFVRNLAIDNASDANAVGLSVATCPGVILENIAIYNHRRCANISTKTILLNCNFEMDDTATGASDYNILFDGASHGSVVYAGSFTSDTGGEADTSIFVKAGNISILDAAISNPDGLVCVRINDAAGDFCRVERCEMETTLVGILVESEVGNFQENRNTISGGAVLFGLSNASFNTVTMRGSREGLSSATLAASFVIDGNSEVNYVEANGNFSNTGQSGATVGIKCIVIIKNISAGAITGAWVAGTISSSASVASLAAGKIRVVHLVRKNLSGTHQWVIMSTSDQA